MQANLAVRVHEPAHLPPVGRQRPPRLRRAHISRGTDTGIGRASTGRPRDRSLRFSDRAAGPPARGHAARAAPGRDRSPHSKRPHVPRGSRGASPCGNPERPAAAGGGVQVPRGARGALRSPGRPGIARNGSLASASLGPRPLQAVAGGRCTRRRLDDEGRGPESVPGSTQAVRAFTAAMDPWDESAADAAAAGLARHASPQEVFEIFARYAARDMRSVGHKAIYVPTPGACSTPLVGSTASLFSARLPTPSSRGGQRPFARRRPRRSPVASQSGPCRPNSRRLADGQDRLWSDRRDARRPARRH